MVALLCKSQTTAGTVATEFEELNAMDVIRSWDGGGQVPEFKCQRKGEHCYHNGRQSQSSNQNSPTHRHQCYWLADTVSLAVK